MIVSDVKMIDSKLSNKTQGHFPTEIFKLSTIEAGLLKTEGF